MCIYSNSHLITDEDLHDEFVVDNFDLICKLLDIPEPHTSFWWKAKIKEEDPFLTDEEVGWVLTFVECAEKVSDIRLDEGEFFETAEILLGLEASHEDMALTVKEWAEVINGLGEEIGAPFTEGQTEFLLSMLEKDGYVKWCP